MAKFYYGNQVSAYGEENGKVDYRAFASSFNHVLNNEITRFMFGETFYFDIVNGCEYDEDTEEYKEIFQYYIVDDFGAREIMENTEDTLWYCEDLDMYVWGIDFYGTSWNYVLTDINC